MLERLWFFAVLTLGGAIPTARLDLSGAVGAEWRRHDGIGILADATTKLLFFYDEPYRGQIIDFFFKPQFGASLSMLKVEIGGDGQQTVGTSSSHQHTADEPPDCSRGMLWWLMRDVKKRREDVQFYGLAWTFPGWVKSAHSDESAEYLAKWVDCTVQNNVSLSFLGLASNEEPACDSAEFAKSGTCSNIAVKRKALNAHGHAGVKIVAPDAFAGPLRSDLETLMNASLISDVPVDIWGLHGAAPLTGLYGELPPGITGGQKPLWNSENEDIYMGVKYLARGLVRAYVETNATAFVQWPLTQGAYEHLPFMNNILPSIANQPWSGAYNISTAVWAFAHLNQFIAPGWLYDRDSSKLLPGGGSVVTLRSLPTGHFTSVFETISCHDMPVCPTCGVRVPPTNCANISDAQRVEVQVPAGVTKVAVWESKVDSNYDHEGWFIQQADLPVGPDGKLELTLAANRMVTVTSQLLVGHKGSYPAPPARRPFPLPYATNFSQEVGSVPRYFLDERGVFEVTSTEHGRVLKQAAPEPEVVWIQGPKSPVSIIGDWSWTAYSVSSIAMVPLGEAGASGSPTYVSVGALVNCTGINIGSSPDGCGDPNTGVFLRLETSGNWSIVRNMNGGLPLVLRSGPPSASWWRGPGLWYRLSLVVGDGGAIAAAINGQQVCKTTDSYYHNGWAAVACGWHSCLYQDFAIIPGGAGMSSMAANVDLVI